MLLLTLAVLPVIGLCFYIYKLDTRKEPIQLLIRLFLFGLLCFIPISACELFLDKFFSVDTATSFINIFVSVFFEIALVEEGFKWLVTKFVGYNSKYFDEVYDIIVYSVFVSLGFACVENILYVFNYGFSVAIRRAILSIPGHACFGVAMGYYFAKAKISSINKNRFLYNKNCYYSILFPVLLHTIYDTFIMHASANYYSKSIYMFSTILFYTFDCILFIYCFIQVSKISKIQRNFNKQNRSVISSRNKRRTRLLCPVCHSQVHNPRFCQNCGTRFKQN